MLGRVTDIAGRPFTPSLGGVRGRCATAKAEEETRRMSRVETDPVEVEALPRKVYDRVHVGNGLIGVAWISPSAGWTAAHGRPAPD